MLSILLLASILSSSPAPASPAMPPTPPKTTTAATTTSPPGAVVGEEQFLAAHAPGVPFTVKVGGAQESYLGKVRSGYFEWIEGEKEGGRLVAFSVRYRTESAIPLTADGQQVSMPPRAVRLYLSPAMEKEFRPTDRKAPEAVRERLNKTGKPVYVAEYRLEAGKTYHAVVHKDTYPLPPEGPGKPAREGTRLVLRISDKPFAPDGSPQVEPTPGYRGWSY